MLEEAANVEEGNGVYVEDGGRLEAMDSAVKACGCTGIVASGSGVVKLARCRINGSTHGIKCATTVGNVSLRDCVLIDNREIGIELPPVGQVPQGLTCCTLRGTSISKSWYPIAQVLDINSGEWVQTVEELTGICMDSRTQLQELTDEDGDAGDWRDYGSDGFSFDSWRTGWSWMVPGRDMKAIERAGYIGDIAR